MQTWKYLVVQFVLYDVERTLNELGDEGWELVSVGRDWGKDSGLDYIAFLKIGSKPETHIRQTVGSIEQGARVTGVKIDRLG